MRRGVSQTVSSHRGEAVEFAQFAGPSEQDAYKYVVGRARVMFSYNGVERTRQEIMMDLCAVHATCPLDIVKLAAFDDLSFAHDLSGIYLHLDRDSGRLGGHFVPRCARR